MENTDSQSGKWVTWTPHKLLNNTVTKVCLPSVLLRCVILYFLLICSFIKGLPVKLAALSEELKQGIGLEPMPRGINYIISTKVHTYSIKKQLTYNHTDNESRHELFFFFFSRMFKAGPGPRVVEDPSQHLLSPDGLPRKL